MLFLHKGSLVSAVASVNIQPLILRMPAFYSNITVTWPIAFIMSLMKLNLEKQQKQVQDNYNCSAKIHNCLVTHHLFACFQATAALFQPGTSALTNQGGASLGRDNLSCKIKVHM